MYEPKHLKRWTRPSDYFGAEWPEYFSSGVGQSRDSDSLERSNFTCMLEALDGESDTVLVIRESHWAVGWVEWIAIHESDDKALAIADDIKRKLEDYPVIDEDHWSDLEWNEACDAWESSSISDRVDLCRRAGVSIFAARRESIPEDDSGYIRERLIGH